MNLGERVEQNLARLVGFVEVEVDDGARDHAIHCVIDGRFEYLWKIRGAEDGKIGDSQGGLLFRLLGSGLSGCFEHLLGPFNFCIIGLRWIDCQEESYKMFDS